MKDRRQLKLSVNNFIARSYTIQSRAKLQMQLWAKLKEDWAERLEKAIHICMRYCRKIQKNKAKTKDTVYFSSELIKISESHMRKVIE